MLLPNTNSPKPLKIPKKLVASACYDKQVPICNHFHIKQANNGRITLFKGVPLFLPLIRGVPLHPAA